MKTPQEFLDTLYYLAKKDARYRLTGGLIFMFTMLLLLWMSAALTDNLFHLSGSNRWGFLVLDLIVIVYLIFRFVGRPLLKLLRLKSRSDLSAMARQLGRLYPDRPDTFINAYQLIREKDENPLKRAAIRQLLLGIDGESLEKSIRLKFYLPSAITVWPVYAAFVFLTVTNFNGLVHSTCRLLDPAHDYLLIPVYNFKILPGNTRSFSGMPLEIKAFYNGPPIDKIILHMTDADSNRSQQIMQKQNSFYTTRIKSLRRSFTYRLSAISTDNPELDGKLQSARYRVVVQSLPDVKELSLQVIPPAYSGLEREKPGSGNVDALKGSYIKIELASNKPLQKAWLKFSDSSTVNLKTRGRQAWGEFRLMRSLRYQIFLLDRDSLQNQARIDYHLSVYPDAPPLVEISKPGADIEIQPGMQVPLQIDAVDDYGLFSASLMYRYLKKTPDADTTWKSYTLPSLPHNIRAAHIQTILDLNEFYIAFGDEMEYYALVADNNRVDGRQYGRSAVYKFTFPTLDALFDDFAQKEDKAVDEMEKIAHGAGDLKKEIEKIRRDLKRTEKMDWAKKKALKDVLKQHEDLQKKVEKIRRDMEKMVDKLEQNNLMSEEILQKYNKLQDMFNELATPELQKALQKLRKAMEKENARQAEKALEEFKLNQESFLQQIERTLDLFKQVQLEQELERLAKQAEDLKKTQKEINKKIAENKPDNKEIQEKLEQQAEKQKALERQLQETLKNKKLDDFDKAREALQKTSEQAQRENLVRRLQQMRQKLDAGQQTKAGRLSQQLQQIIARQSQQLNNAMKSVRDANKIQVQKAMAAAARKLLQLSRAQERLSRETKGASNVNEQLQKLGRKQDQIRQNLNKVINDIVSLSRKTFFIPPSLSGQLSAASREMENALNSLSDRRTSRAAGSQQKAMGALNRGAQGLQKSMQNMKGSQSGTGFEEFLKKMQEMAGAQGGVNQGTMQLFAQQGKGGQRGMKQGMNGQRLAARQKAIRDALEQMAAEQAGRRDMLGRLDKMGADMDEIIHDLLNNNVTRKTIRRQQQILSRMLDAQKSAQTRKLSKKRRAIKPGHYVAKDPKKLGAYENTGLKKILEAMRRVREQGFSGDYEKLINAYYKALLSAQKKSVQQDK